MKVLYPKSVYYLHKLAVGTVPFGEVGRWTSMEAKQCTAVGATTKCCFFFVFFFTKKQANLKQMNIIVSVF